MAGECLIYSVQDRWTNQEGTRSRTSRNHRRQRSYGLAAGVLDRRGALHGPKSSDGVTALQIVGNRFWAIPQVGPFGLSSIDRMGRIGRRSRTDEGRRALDSFVGRWGFRRGHGRGRTSEKIVHRRKARSKPEVGQSGRSVAGRGAPVEEAQAPMDRSFTPGLR